MGGFNIMKIIGKIKRLSRKKELRLSEEELAKYLKALRKQDEQSWIGSMKLEQRRKWHPFLRILMKANRLFMGIKVEKLNTNLPPMLRKRPIIFVLTHVGRDDIIVLNEVLSQHYTILIGDYESLHNNVLGLISMLNGTVFFDMKSKEDRAQVEDRVIQVLRGGDNILCSMEAAWNLSPNELVQELFPGMIRAALKSDAVIVCVGIERFSAKLYGINIAKEVFDPKRYQGQNKETKIAIDKMREDLRQYMAELKFELYYHERIQKKITVLRKEIGDYDIYESRFIQDILKGWTFTEQIIEQKKYRNKEKPKYAFEYVVKRYTLMLEKPFQIDTYIELLKDIKNPVYPNCIHRRLLELLGKINNMSTDGINK